MIAVLMVWLYFALLFSLMQWPDKIWMLITFVLLAGPPLLMLYRIFVMKRRPTKPGEAGDSMQAGVSKEDHQHPSDD